MNDRLAELKRKGAKGKAPDSTAIDVNDGSRWVLPRVPAEAVFFVATYFRASSTSLPILSFSLALACLLLSSVPFLPVTHTTT